MLESKRLAAVILAAGKGTRMKSELPKVLHRTCGKPMLQQILGVTEKIGVSKTVVVVGHGAELVRQNVQGQAECVVQESLLGTGHAVLQAREALSDFDGIVMVLCGDTPLLRSETLAALFEEHQRVGAAATVLSAFMPDAGYGRIIRDEEGNVLRIVERKDATEEELEIEEFNSGIFCFDSQKLFTALDKVGCNNSQGEYYLTDVISILANSGEKVWATPVVDYQETLGVNSKVQLAEAEAVLRLRNVMSHMENGVTVMDPASTFIDSDVVIGQDTVLYPFTWLESGTVIGTDCTIGPNTRLQDAKIGNGVTLQFTYAHECEVDDDVSVGPYAHIRPGTYLAKGVRVGNFVEIKNSQVGEGSKIPHLSYIGDTDMGRNVNMGSGSITVNYDGINKHRTTLHDGAFVGCNTNLVAPVVVGKNAYTGAGSTITKNVPDGALALSRSKQVNFEGWGAQKKQK